MSINNLQGFLASIMTIRDWALIVAGDEEDVIDPDSLVDLSEEDLADLSEEDLVQIRDLQDPDPVLLQCVYELKRQCSLVINTNEKVCTRIQKIFSSRSKIFRLIIFSGFFISSVQLRQQWTSLHEEELLQTKKIQDLVVKSLMTGFFFGVCCTVDSQDLLEYLSDHLSSRIERFRSRFQLLSNI